MKRIVSIIAMLSALSVAETLNAQCTDCEVKGINTDPRDDGANAQNCEDANKTNQFYWFDSQLDAFYSYAGGSTTSSFNSPFWAIGSGHIIGTHAGQHLSDFHPEDGWELLKFDNGYLADNTTQRSTAKEMIYFCYYNKHRGLMRFFGMMPSGAPYHTIRFKIEIPRWKKNFTQPQGFDYNPQSLSASNTLSIQGNSTQPLDQETEEYVLEVVTEFPGGSPSQHWFWFEVPVAYDPCICYNDVAIAMTAVIENNWNLTIKGVLDGKVIQETQPDGNGYQSLVLNRIIGAAAATVTAIVTKGAVIQTSSFIDLLDIYKDKPGASPADKARMTALKNLLHTTSNFVYDTQKGEWRDFSTNEKVSEKDWKEIYAGINKFITGTHDFINPASGGSKTTTSVVGNITAVGSVTTSLPTNAPIYWGMPGSKMSKNLNEEITAVDDDADMIANYYDPEYPLYNEVLGTLAMLKTPRVNVINKVLILCDHILTETDPWNPESPPITTGGQTIHPKYTFQLAEDFLYYFNPLTNINLEKTKISVAYVVTGGKLFNPDNIVVDPLNPHLTFCSELLESVLNNLSLNVKRNILDEEYVSPFIPIDQFKELVVSLVFNKDFNPFLLEDYLYVRFLIEYESNDLGKSGQPVRNLQIFTFPVKADNETMLSSPLIDVIRDDDGHHFNTHTTFTNNDILFFNGLVTISAILNTSPGVKKVIYSLTGFEMLAGGQIFSDIELRIGYPLGHHAQPMQTASFVSNFCQNQIPALEYKAKDFSAAAIHRMQKEQEEREEHIKEKIVEDNDLLRQQPNPFTLHPNPNNGTFTISFERALAANAVLVLTDLAGRSLHTQTLPAGQRGFAVQTHNLASGVYFVSITQGEERKTQKVVVQP